jgi:hypothetical protein
MGPLLLLLLLAVLLLLLLYRSQHRNLPSRRHVLNRILLFLLLLLLLVFHNRRTTLSRLYQSCLHPCRAIPPQGTLLLFRRPQISTNISNRQPLSLRMKMTRTFVLLLSTKKKSSRDSSPMSVIM